MADPTEQQRMTLIHLEEQSLAAMQKYRPTIERIAKHGPQQGDDLVVRMVFCHMVGRLLCPNP
jgi:hypothetical protein